MIIISAEDLRLTLVQEGKFLGITCSFYEDEDGNIYMSRRQIGEALGYKNPIDAVYRIHERRGERFENKFIKLPIDKLSIAPNNSSDNTEVVMYNEDGIYEICRHSKQKVANDFYDYVVSVIKTIKKDGAYIATEKDDEWLGARTQSIAGRNQVTKVIQEFKEYAIAQGSKNADKYFIHYTNLANKTAGIPNGGRGDADTAHQLLVYGVEQFMMAMLRKQMKAGIPYKEIYKNVKKVMQYASIDIDN